MDGASGGSAPTTLGIALDALVRLPRAESISRDLRETASATPAPARAGASAPSCWGPSRLGLPRHGAAPGSARRDALSQLPLVASDHAFALVQRIVSKPGLLPHGDGDTPWTIEELMGALRGFVTRHDADGRVPFVPASRSVVDAVWKEAGEEWRWGIAPVVRIGTVVLDVLRRAMWHASWQHEGAGAQDQREAVRGARRKLHDALAKLHALQGEHEAYWLQTVRERLGAPPQGSRPGDEARRSLVARWTEEAIAGWAALQCRTPERRRRHASSSGCTCSPARWSRR